jgi:hypothetical protein
MDKTAESLSRNSTDRTNLRFSLRALLIATAVFALIIRTEGFGLIGFYYPIWIENEPLNNPVEVVWMSPRGLHLVDGRVVAVTWRPEILKDALDQSRNLIELESDDEAGMATIYVKRRITKCGTSWVRLINFNWFPDEIPSFYRYPLDRATVIEPGN